MNSFPQKKYVKTLTTGINKHFVASNLLFFTIYSPNYRTNTTACTTPIPIRKYKQAFFGTIINGLGAAAALEEPTIEFDFLVNS